MNTENATMDRGNATIWIGDAFLNVFEPNIDVMSIENLAHGLAKKDRASGFYDRVFSVAEHSILCSRIANILAKEKLPLSANKDVFTRVASLEALIHDGSEGYLIDMPRPIKHHPDMDIFRSLEENMQHSVNQKFLGYTYMQYADIVKQADNEALMFEFWMYMPGARINMPWCKDWHTELWIKATKGLDFINYEMNWRDVKSLFINEYKSIVDNKELSLVAY